MNSTGFDRRSILKAGAAAVGFGSVTTSVAADGEFDPESAAATAERLGPADVTGVEDRLRTVDAATVPESVDGLGPGSMLFITRDGEPGTAACTANFVWEGADGTKYLGAAGHCFLQDAAIGGTRYDGEVPNLGNVTVRACIDCTFGGATALALGLRGEVIELGEVVYARQADDGTQIGSDFGLAEIPPEAEALIDASMPTWGGPSETGEINGSDPLVQYGNGVVTGETVATKSRSGLGTENDGNAGSWFAALPAAPGDSGSAVQVAQPSVSGLSGVEAAGVLTHVTTAGTAGTNVQKATQMATEAGLDIDVVLADV